MSEQSVNPVLVDLRNHITQMAPHQKDRRGGQLLIRSRDEIERLLWELKLKIEALVELDQALGYCERMRTTSCGEKLRAAEDRLLEARMNAKP